MCACVMCVMHVVSVFVFVSSSLYVKGREVGNKACKGR